MEIETGSTVTRHVRDERGQGLVEYALILALVSLAAIVALGFLSSKINTLFSKAGNSLNNVPVASGGPVTPPGEAAPTVTGLSANTGGNNILTDGDSITIVFSEPLNTSTLCNNASWSGPGNHTVANAQVTADNTSNGTSADVDTLTVTSTNGFCSGGFQLGTISLGGNFLSGSGLDSKDWEPVTITWNEGSNSLTLSGWSNGAFNPSCSSGCNNAPGATTMTYAPDSDIRDRDTVPKAISGGGTSSNTVWF